MKDNTKELRRLIERNDVRESLSSSELQIAKKILSAEEGSNA